MTQNVTSQRATALDALRGYAILTMVLSGTIAYGILPGWMYHAQVPPPLHKFDPSIFGLTWVDLVFPFFLFSMGAAFPFSIGRKLHELNGFRNTIVQSFLRGAQLAFFAIYIEHLHPWVISEPQDTKAWLITLFAFALMFPIFMRLPSKISKTIRYAVKVSAYALGILLLLTLNYANNRTFSVGYSDIIILVLANMAIFGSLIYILTYRNRLARIAILPFIMAVFLGSSNEGSWVHWLFNLTPAVWFYKFYYLKYLFIVIPGTLAGEYLLEWINTAQTETESKRTKKSMALMLVVITFGLVLLNLIGLYSRLLVMNLLLTSALLIFGLVMLKKGQGSYVQLWKKLFESGAYLLILGLFFEAYEGGIRKDHSTYSYYFVTSGLAFMALIFFSVICDFFRKSEFFSFLVMAGQNPMLAYVGSAMLIMPLLILFGLADFLTFFNSNPWLGFLKGILITTLVALATIFFTRIKWFWRT